LQEQPPALRAKRPLTWSYPQAQRGTLSLDKMNMLSAFDRAFLFDQPADSCPCKIRILMRN